ncbi:dehydrogenase, putative [Candida dubliniensis CD36]|uniref:Dehydrogenase, putative n=1 Tax=Candida dubliniensis (strain CD36 / ATCC MYA-646 / CBS 7987 / NCPF 3949 / NRRL Y-17841) TaxID=573826 RepID=B9WBA8_CANDC|nr:dehydrogenase, putative [Candida dubliniensis CD36]CAX43678.1 dehydrogenase, putative [Candida dubliniensis CD36]
MSSFELDSLPYLNPNVDRRIAFITGGSSGLGFYTVLQLYLHGYTVYIAGRSKSRCLKSIKELKNKAIDIRSTYTSLQLNERFLGDLRFLEIDLSNLTSVITAVENFKKLEDHLHILINNAGAMALPYTLTIDKFEIQLQTNFISPLVLTTKLLPILQKTTDKFPKLPTPRIIYLSSFGHQFALQYFNLNNGLNYYPNFIFTWIRYGMAKVAGIHFMKMLALRNPKVLFLTVHPGLVMNTNLFSYWTRLPIVGIIFWFVFYLFGYFFGVTSEQGANVVIKCALNENLTVEIDNGKYFGPNGKESQPSNIATNMDYAARTWIWTIKELNQRGIEIPNP